MAADVSIKIDGLDRLAKALKAKVPTVKVGILGSNNARSDGSASNATIGATHEFGTTVVPMRSFLRIPLSTYLEKGLQSSGAFTKRAIETVIAEKSLLPWVEKMGIEAVGIVLDAFDSNGFGSWAPLMPETLAHKQVKQTLVETQQLRDSITYEVSS